MDGVWTNPGSSSWSAGFNWSNASPPAGAGATANFQSPVSSAGITVTLDGTRTVGTLVFDNNAPDHEWSLRSGGGGPLILDNLTGTPVVRVNQGSALIGSQISGNRGFVKEGNGMLMLNGSNNFSGPIAVKEGTLRFGAPPEFPAGLKIMPLGDSITYGWEGSNAGYRGPLYSLLKPLATNFLYVGTSQERQGFLPFEQRYNEGHSSYTLQDTSNNLDGFDNSCYLRHLPLAPERNPNGGFWLTGGGSSGRPPIKPDIILMMLGTNDLDNPVGVEDRLQALMTKIFALCPKTKLFVAKIIPARNFVPFTAVTHYNATVETTVASFKAAGADVHLVDLFRDFPLNGLIADQVHPNDTGFNWMAIQWHEAILRAYTPERGLSLATFLFNPITISKDAALDLRGTETYSGKVATSGEVDLGNHGVLYCPLLEISATGRLRGSGVVEADVMNSGDGIGTPGGDLTIRGKFTNNRRLDAANSARLKIEGDLVNNGIISGGPDQIPVFQGSVVNNGIIRVTDGASLQVSGTFVNNGILDVMTGHQELPANFVNNGLLIDRSAVALHSFESTPDLFWLRVEGRTGHVYQAQCSETMEDATWTDTGDPVEGVTGELQSLPVPLGPPGGSLFYRIKVSP